MKAVILAGGSGTRLWPLSTKDCPKQFHKIASNKTMIEDTIDRIDFLKKSDIYLSINKNHLKLVKKLCPGIPSKNIIIEPAMRDTASGIGLAAAIIAKRYPKEVMAVIYADHVISNKKEFQKSLKIAEKLALKEDTLNIIEVPATEPNTNYGYVKLGKLNKKIDNTEIYNLDCFVEKPDLKKAKEFLKSGKYLWNTGLYVWKAATLLENYKKFLPDTYKKLEKMMTKYDTKDQNKTLNSLYPTLEKISIDYAIMEKVPPTKIRIIKTKNLGWSDVGTWETVWKFVAKKAEKNKSQLDCKNTIIYSENNKKIIAISLENIIVIDTKDGLLVCKKEDAKRIKELQSKL
ncbi:MAG: sugar phosphate nucleotidyltransferase [Candidatus Gracilibacteria bacterium]|jgi:mannose-1-phosphate guanylyltransferase